jgi:light-regulated signal transduction histidine kinase (bacteriophytochrome)
LTHDVKNILQSLRALMAAAEASGPEDADRLQQLLKRQLPQMAQRLQNTVDKLRQPSELDHQVQSVAKWWEGLKARYAQDQILFEPAELQAEGNLPQDLFDSVADNLLTNALRKRREQAAGQSDARYGARSGRTGGRHRAAGTRPCGTQSLSGARHIRSWIGGGLVSGRPAGG